MAEQILSAERVRELFNYNPLTGELAWKCAAAKRLVNAKADYPHNKGYLYVTINSKRYLSHRLAWLHFYGVMPKDQLDHINQVKSDNRIENLREVTNKQNHENMPLQKNNKSGMAGVHWFRRKQKWIAYIKHNKVRYNLGSFTTKEDAVSARIAAEVALYTHSPSCAIA